MLVNFCSVTQFGLRPSIRSVATLFLVENAPDAALLAVGNVQRPIRTLSHTIRTSRGIIGSHERRLSGEAIGENFKVTRRLATRERLERNVVAFHRHRRAIPRTVEGDKCAITI